MLFVTWNVSTTEIPAFSELGFADVFSITVSDGQGIRTLVELETSDPRLEPVSNTRAEGYGFNLYAGQPELLPSSYGQGMPAAQISGWHTTGFAVDTSGPIKIDIQLRDGQDGIMDTEVLIRDIALTAFIPPQFTSVLSEPDTQRGLPPPGACLPLPGYCNILFPLRGQTTGQNQPPIPPRFCTFSENQANDSLDLRSPVESRGTVVGRLIADGNTKWPLAAGVFDSDVSEVEFTMVDSTAPQDGGLGEFDTIDRLQTITIPASEVAPGFFGAEVQYFVPDTYFSDDLEIANEFVQRSVFVRGCLKNLMGITRFCRQLEVELYRPDIILMHGLWSGGDAWTRGLIRPFVNLGVSEPEIPDYSSTNAASFEENRYEPRDAMAKLCAENSLASIRGTQFDYVGHSMGGLLARVYLYRVAPYRTINRLYTMNTPHLGSPLATLLVELRKIPGQIRAIVFSASSLTGRPINDGAIDDLAEGSAALRAIPFTPVLSHSLAGTGGLSLDEYRETNITIIDAYTILRFFTNFTFAFDGEHDTIVSSDSQIGGIDSGSFSLFDGEESIHTSVTRSPEYAGRLFCEGPACPDDPVGFGRNDLMNKSGTGAFGFFPSPDGLMPTNRREVSEPVVSNLQSTVTEMGITLMVPGGLTVEPGDTVQVAVESVAPFVADSVILFSEFDIVIDNEAPLEFNLEVPQDLIGDLVVTAIAKDSQGNYATSDITLLSSQTSATLTEINTNPENVFLGGSDDVRTLWVQGLYDDGVERTITSPATGTTYMSSDPSIVTVSAEGVLRPESNGVATIIVSNGTVQDSISVDVRGVISVVFSDGFESIPAAR